MEDYALELFGVNSEQTLRFFIDSLRAENPPRGSSSDELFYVSSVLASYAQTPRFNSEYALAGDLSELFDMFIVGAVNGEMLFHEIHDPEILEIAGSQILLFAGFFRKQMRRRHNVHWYDSLGASLYERASDGFIGRKAEMMERIAEHFGGWTKTCSGMSHKMWENRLIIKT